MQVLDIHISGSNAPKLGVSLSANDICVNKLKAHDKNAFKSLYRLYASAINGSICRNVSDRYKSDLILERTFINAWDNILAFDSKNCKLFTWLIRISNEECKKLN